MIEIQLLEETLDSFFNDTDRIVGEINYRMDQLALESLFNPEITLESGLKDFINTFSNLMNKTISMVESTMNGIVNKLHSVFKKDADFVKEHLLDLKDKYSEVGKEFKYTGSYYRPHFVILQTIKYANEMAKRTQNTIDGLDKISTEELEKGTIQTQMYYDQYFKNDAGIIDQIAKTMQVEKGATVKETKANYFKKAISEPEEVIGFKLHSCDEMLYFSSTTAPKMLESIKTQVGIISKGVTAWNTHIQVLNKQVSNEELIRRLNAKLYLENSFKIVKKSIEVDKMMLLMYKEFIVRQNNEFMMVLRKLLKTKTSKSKEETTQDSTIYFDDLI